MLIKKIFYRELVDNAMKILIVMVFILPMTELFKLLEDGGTSGIPTQTLLAFVLYGTIASFPMILTISCFLTIVITINRYCKDHEFVIWLSSGVSPFMWLKLVTQFAIPICVLCAISTIYITPWATNKKDEYAEYLSKQKTNIMITPGIFRENSSGKDVFYLDHYSLVTGYAKYIFIQYTRDDDVVYNVTAMEGKIDNADGITSVTLKNANRYQTSNGNNDNYGRFDIKFDELQAKIKQDYNPLKLVDRGVNTFSLSHLINVINNKHNKDAQAELSWRLSIAIMMFVMMFLAVPISIQVGRIQSNFVFILPPIIYAIYNQIILTLNGYINQGITHSMIVVQMIHIGLILIGLLLTYYKTYPKGYWFSRNKK